MDENLHDIDNIFRDSLEGHEEMPPPGVWDAIDQSLDKSSVVAIRKKYNDLKKLAAVLVVVLTAALAWGIYANYYDDNSSGNNVSNEAQNNNRLNDKTLTADSVNKLSPAENNNDTSSLTPAETVQNENVNANTAGNNITADSDENNAVQQTGETSLPVNKNAKTLQQPVNATVEENTTGNTSQLAEPANATHHFAVKAAVTAGAAAKRKNINTATAATDNKATATTNEQNLNSSETVAGDAGNKEETMEENYSAKRGYHVEPLASSTEKAAIDMQQGYDLPVNNAALNNGVASIMVSRKTFKGVQFSVMPFYAWHNSSNRIEEDHHSYSGPGGGPSDHHDRDRIRESENHLRSYSYGLQLSATFNRKMMIQTGISYFVKNIAIDPKNIVASADSGGHTHYRFDCSSGFAYLVPKGAAPAVGDTIQTGPSKNTLSYLTVPLNISYRFFNGKFHLMPTLGTAINFLVNQEIETELVSGSTKQPQTINSINGLKKSYFSGTAALGFEYDLGRKIMLNLSPAYNFALQSINQQASVKSYPKSVSLAAGIRINL